MPHAGWLWSFVDPSIVNVLRVPVWPYEKIVELYPSRTDKTALLDVFS